LYILFVVFFNLDKKSLECIFLIQLAQTRLATKKKTEKRFSGLQLQACGSSLKNEKILNVVNYFQLAYHKKSKSILNTK